MVKLQQPNVALVHQMPFLVLCLISVFCIVSMQPLSHISILYCVNAASVSYQYSVWCQCSLCLISVFCIVSMQPLSHISILYGVNASSTEIVEDMVVKLQQFSLALVHQLRFSCPLSYVRILCCVTAASV